jgi:hypothetical protein
LGTFDDNPFQLALTNSSLDKPQGQNFLKVATEDKLAAKAVIVEGENSKVWTNKPNGIPVSEAHRLLTTIKNGKTGFVWNDRNYISHYTFLTENKQIIKISYGDLNVSVAFCWEQYWTYTFRLKRSVPRI